MNTSQPETVRAPVATTLASADPLAASNCGLPTAPGVACAEAPPPEKKDDPHQHHQHGAPPPAPEAPAAPEKKKEADPHQHHQGSAAPKRPAPAATVMAPTKVIDPVCKMKIDPKKAGGGSLRHDGQQHFFCSESCRHTFLSQHPGAK